MRDRILNKFITLLTILKKEPLKKRPVFTKDFEDLKHFKIGDFTYGHPKVVDWGQNTKLEIGKFCSIANGVKILLGGEHVVDNITTYPFKEIIETWNEPEFPFTMEDFHCKDSFSKGDVIIGNDVWIAENVTILSGVKIGDGAVLGAGSVVTKTIEPYSIVVGNPAKIIRKRFNDETIKQLLDLKWWDWSTERIDKQKNQLMNPFKTDFIINNKKQLNMGKFK